MFYVDLDEVKHLPRALFRIGRVGWLSFCRADYLGDASSDLKTAVLDRVEASLGVRPSGPVRLLTQVRSLGYVFNPVSLYYCFAADGRRLEAVVAEITNTPWGERHAYVLPASMGRRDEDFGLRFRFGKRFHVSPFMPMDQQYDWTLGEPGPALRIRMLNRTRGGERVFDAALALERREITGRNLARSLARHPVASLDVLRKIHWQALRLWLKRAPFYGHPRARAEETTT